MKIEITIDQIREFDLGKKKWPWGDDAIDEVEVKRGIEYLTDAERGWFMSELYRVLKPKGKATMTTPHWCSARAYVPGVQWPPISEWFYYHLNAGWRKEHAPHVTNYLCDFDSSWGSSLHPALTARNPETQGYMSTWYKEAVQALVATLTKR
jgi:ubiquinone/menaquinone biosynthesis C-methylase UbiE